MRTKDQLYGEAVKRIDYMYMQMLKRIFRPLGIKPQCRWQGCPKTKIVNGETVPSREFQEGDRVVSKMNKQRGSKLPPIWHADCFEKMFY